MTFDMIPSYHTLQETVYQHLSMFDMMLAYVRHKSHEKNQTPQSTSVTSLHLYLMTRLFVIEQNNFII